jgi:enterochelin esterase family protein
VYALGVERRGRVLLLVLSCLWPRAAFAQLAVDKPAALALRAKTPQSLQLMLREHECAFGRVDIDAANTASALSLHVLAGRRATPLRRFDDRDQPGHIEFGFCVQNAGSYRLELRAANGGGYHVLLEAILGRPHRPPRAAAVESPALRRVEDGTTKLDAFWADIQRRGTPLIEQRTPDSYLVTFLYRGTPDTGAVHVAWPAWTNQFAENDLARLGTTDVWFKSVVMPEAARMSYQLAIDTPLDPRPGSPLELRLESAVSRADPLNPRLLFEDPESDAYGLHSVFELPGAPPEPWWKPEQTKLAGRFERQSVPSVSLGNTHVIDVYLPRGYGPKQPPYSLLIVFDGEGYIDRIPTPRLLDQLIAAHEIAPLITVFVRNVTPESRNDELPCNPRFADFIARDLMPLLRAHYGISDDPARIGLAGSSFGGLASSYIALMHPELFGKVLSQSGAYWWSFPASSKAYDGSTKPGWLQRRFAERQPVPVQFYLSAGVFETDPSGAGVLEQNRAFRELLRRRGYSVAYQEFVGGHDPLQWRATLPDGLRALFAPGR